VFPEKPSAYSYSHEMRSRYSETDQMGYVYYGRYLEYFEEARTEMIRTLGMPYRQMEENGVMLPVIHTQVDYKLPVFYDELMRIEVHLYDLPVVKLETYYKVFTQRSEEAHVLGLVTLCFTDRESRKPCRVPQSFIDKLTSAGRWT
jgi:acyl-CoA thioester hydrolase